MSKLELNKIRKKNTLLQTSFDLFLEKGFAKTTISDIVNRAGLAKGTFYLYYKDKYDLRDKLIIYKTQQLFHDAHLALNKQPVHGFENQLLFIMDHVIHSLEDNHNLLNFIAKNLSWGIFKNAFEKSIADEPYQFYELISELLEKDHKQCSNLDIMLFSIIEIAGGACHSCILYQQPVSMDVYLPYLHDIILSIMKMFITPIADINE